METTLPIPAEIVGDTPTIRARLDALDCELLASALCLGRRPTADYHLAAIVEHTAVRDLLSAERERRWIARDLAYADQPARMVTR